VHVPRGLAREIVRRSAPREFTQHARNPARSVQIGASHTVFAPAYGPPFVSDLDGGRRYGTLEDFRNFVKLTYASPWLHHSGGTVCEPVDVPVNKRHLDMVYAHIRYSDKPFMGSVTSAARAADSIEMCRLLFGADFVESHCVILGNVNVNSPLVLDGEASRVIRTYAAANQAPVCVPFIDRPAGAAARRAAALRRESLRVQDRRCPGGLRERELDVAGVPRGRELRAARGGLARGGAGDVLREIRHGRRSVGCVPYELADNNSFEQWSAEGGRDLLQRANRRWKSLLEAYQPPPLDPARDEALREYVTRRKRAMPDEPG